MQSIANISDKKTGQQSAARPIPAPETGRYLPPEAADQA